MASVLRSQKVALIACGLLPLNTRNALLDNGITLFCTLNLLHIFVLVCLRMFCARDASFEERTAQIQDLAALVTSLTYLLVFALKRRHIQAAIAAVEWSLPSRSLPGLVHMEMGGCVRRARKFSLGMCVTFSLGTVYHGLQPLFRGRAFEAFPFHTEYPWPWALQSPCYECLFALQLVAQAHLGLLFASFMALFVSVARILTVQFEMLLLSIRNVTSSALIRSRRAAADRGQQATRVLARLVREWREGGDKRIGKQYFEGEEVQEEGEEEWKVNALANVDMAEDNGQDLFRCGEFDEELLVAVIECAKRHALILGICRKVEDILSFNMLNTIGLLTGVLCILIHALMSIGELNESTVDFANYLVLGYFEMLIMCYFPHLMSYQSGMVTPAINDIPWHLFGPRVRKYLLVIMCNAQKPFYFTCGQLFNIDLELFMLSAKMSFSFYMLLRNLNG